jgi:hypothetical protein
VITLFAVNRDVTYRIIQFGDIGIDDSPFVMDYHGNILPALERHFLAFNRRDRIHEEKKSYGRKYMFDLHNKDVFFC